ncbi:MAG: carbon storage regulator CsrA [Bacillota bacterium]
MLVLSRKSKQSIVIGDNIEVQILDIRGDTVRLGIIAPPEVPVHRREVYEEIREENRRAARTPTEARRILEEVRKKQ